MLMEMLYLRSEVGLARRKEGRKGGRAVEME